MKDIKGYKGLYAISEDGKVWSYPKHKNSTGGGASHNGIFLKIQPPSIAGREYNSIVLRKNGITKQFCQHRLIAETFISNPLNLKEVNHINGIKTDNRIENLEWVSPLQNVKKAWETGLCTPRIGVLNGRAVLKESDILKIRELGESKNYKEIGEEFNVSNTTIWRILKRKNWAHIDNIPILK